jgi:glutamyl-tRNA(Gln) amidotransferase subunit E
MQDLLTPIGNYERTRALVGYVPRREATQATYESIGYMCGLEIHQQLKTKSKLFCRCPAGIYQKDGEFDAELVRHMRPTLSEMGEYDGTALMEKRTRKNIVYRIADETACTYDIDDTPPFPLDREALGIALEVSLLLGLNIVGELHITRKQYLDGSIPTGFQRTGIIGIEGEIPLKGKTIRIIQLSLEEDSCRERSDVGHWRVYTTDRLGMPLIETVTYPDMKTPDEAAAAAHYLRFVARSTGKVRTGIGAAREDVNVSARGGTRVEIKGVAHIRWIPELTHNEAFRQVALLKIRDELTGRVKDWSGWTLSHVDLDPDEIGQLPTQVIEAHRRGDRVVAMNLPEFGGLLTHFTQPERIFAHELADRLKVIACIERPNIVIDEMLGASTRKALQRKLGSAPEDAQIVVWGPPEDIPTALEIIQERCVMAFEGVPSETRKGLPDGTTIFERVLPGPDRMYPDTDTAPIPIEWGFIEQVRAQLPPPVAESLKQLRAWGIPEPMHGYLLRRNLVGLMRRIVEELEVTPRYVAHVLAHTLKHIEGTVPRLADFSFDRVYDLFAFAREKGLTPEIVEPMLSEVYCHPNMVLDSVLKVIGYAPVTAEQLASDIPTLDRKFATICTSRDPQARYHWIMGRLRKRALGNLPLAQLGELVERSISHE